MGMLAMWQGISSMNTSSAVVEPPRPCGPMPSALIFSSSSASMAAMRASGCVLPTSRRSAFLASTVTMSMVPPMPTPMITGGHGLEPALETVSTTALTMPFHPCEGLSILRLLMFSAPPPLAIIVRRTLSPGTMLVWMIAGVLSLVLRRVSAGVLSPPGILMYPAAIALHHPTSAGDDRRRLLDLLVECKIRAQRDALLDGLHGHRRGLAREHLPVVHGRHDVVGLEALVFGHLGQLHGRGDAHLVGDGLGAHVQSAAEDAGEADRVVDLVGEVGAAGGDHGGAGLLGVPGPHLGGGVGADEDDRVGGHRLDPVLLDGVRALLAEGDAHVGALEGVGDAAGELLF